MNSLNRLRRTSAPRCLITFLALVFSTLGAHAASYVVDMNQPTLDKWLYPFGGGGGSNVRASVFAAIGNPDFDDRDAQFYLGFNTNTIVPTGLGASNYIITSAKLTLSMGLGPDGEAPDVIFDDDYDAVNTYGPNGEQINNDDPGRPMELYGVGYRNGTSNLTVTNSTLYGGTGEGTRSLHPTDFAGGVSLSGSVRDVSNNVTQAFNPTPFSIGQVAPGDLTGGKIDEAADIVFTLTLTPDVIRYLQLSLNEGRISLIANSLHTAEQFGPTVYPVYNTLENALGDPPGRLYLVVETIPEPSAVTLLFLGFGLFVGCYRGVRAWRNKEILS